MSPTCSFPSAADPGFTSEMITPPSPLPGLAKLNPSFTPSSFMIMTTLPSDTSSSVPPVTSSDLTNVPSGSTRVPFECTIVPSANTSVPSASLRELFTVPSGFSTVPSARILVPSINVFDPSG